MINYILNKYAALQFWWVKKTLKLDRDFKFNFEDSSPLGFSVTILRGKCEDTEIMFSDIRVDEINGVGQLNFNTVLLKNPKNLDEKDSALVRLSSNIMRLVLTNSIEMVEKNEIRKTDPYELDEERELYAESDPVSEKRVSKRKSRAKDVSGDSGVHPDVQQPAKRKRTKAATRSKGKSN